jgi:hypothetical protein
MLSNKNSLSLVSDEFGVSAMKNTQDGSPQDNLLALNGEINQHGSYLAHKSRRRICVVYSLGRGKFWWDLLNIALAIFNCFSIPFMLAFQPPFAQSMVWEIINWVITAIFAIDCVVNMRTSYFDVNLGEEVFVGKMMAHNYLLSSRFVLDFLSTIPFDIMFEGLVT